MKQVILSRYAIEGDEDAWESALQTSGGGKIPARVSVKTGSRLKNRKGTKRDAYDDLEGGSSNTSSKKKKRPKTAVSPAAAGDAGSARKGRKGATKKGRRSSQGK